MNFLDVVETVSIQKIEKFDRERRTVPRPALAGRGEAARLLRKLDAASLRGALLREPGMNELRFVNHVAHMIGFIESVHELSRRRPLTSSRPNILGKYP
jgi:hypothetical protein